MNISVNDESKIGVVIIGRNEGQRLVNCLSSVNPKNNPVIYVDSDSTDDSVENAKRAGAEVINLDMSKPFSAARARNTGWKYLINHNMDIEFIQFIDGDCELQPNWLEQAQSFLTSNNEYAVVSGRVREQFPEASLYNKFCNDEWNTPIGDTKACGGNAFIRIKSLLEVDGYKDYFIAGEEPEMCYRLRQNSWKIYRLDEEMTLHDANMTKFHQWWQRAKRHGFATALTVYEHGTGEENLGLRETIRPLAWTAILFIILIIATLSPIYLFLLFIYPLQIIRMFFKKKNHSLYSLKSCAFLMLGKIPESLGIIQFIFKHINKQPYTIIEHK